jgi:ribosomal protein L37AE/L43A
MTCVVGGRSAEPEAVMSRNAVQFQKGLGLGEFQKLYGTEEQCHDHLVQQRWPNGFVCPKCAQTKHSYAAPKRIFQCSACRTQTSAKSGTLFHASRTPLTKWYLAIHLVASSKNDVAALELARQLDVKWDTAWLIKQKLMEAMRQRNRAYKLKGTIQIDDAYLGGEKPRIPGKSGRGAPGKTPFVIAVETRATKPIYTHVRRVKAFDKKEIKAYAEANIEPGSWVHSDGLGCFNGLAEAGMKHVPVVSRRGRPDEVRYKWVNVGLGNLKSALVGTCRSCDAHHVDRYLAAYEWRFNRRFDLRANLGRLARIAALTAPAPYRSIAAVRTKSVAEPSG